MREAASTRVFSSAPRSPSATGRVKVGGGVKECADIKGALFNDQSRLGEDGNLDIGVRGPDAFEEVSPYLRMARPEI